MSTHGMAGTFGARPGWLARLGLAMMAAAAGGERGGSRKVRAVKDHVYGHKRGKKRDDDDGGATGMACCHLALPDKECRYKGDKSNYTCPEGWHRQWWFCCEGTRQAGCGECTKSESTCWSGPFECSIWWWTGQSC